MIKSLAAVLLFLPMAAAQTSSYQGQSWVGLLVSSSCEKPGKAARESDLTTNGRTTTPAVDASGTRGSAENDTPTSSQKQTLPETGDVMAKVKSTTDPAWVAAHRQAQALGSSCRLDANTMQFALLLPDGAMLQFDQVANQTIAKQMPSLPMGAKNRKILRVSVQGKMQNGKIALDSIQM